MIDFLFDGPKSSPLTLALAHGAGAGMDHPFMETMAKAIAQKSGIRVARFEFPYMAAKRADGKKRPPDRSDKLIACYREAIEQLGGADKVVVGGKSMGGRMASLIAEDAGARGLVCLGYPFHPVGKPDVLRTSHLLRMRLPTIIVQGTRDSFGGPETVRAVSLPPAIQIYWIGDGDHSFKPTKASGRTEAEALDEASTAVADYLADLA
ncbi:MAG TPA: alpha/beta family hydrolase [Alphaproteobacteria bacterium]|nr:alpha/beta family hydrolase [Alphaproteobacteria bacterium]